MCRSWSLATGEHFMARATQEWLDGHLYSRIIDTRAIASVPEANLGFRICFTRSLRGKHTIPVAEQNIDTSRDHVSFPF